MTTRQHKLIDLLASGKHSVIGIMQILNIADPRSTIRDLRKLGYNVRDEWLETTSGNRFKMYWIESNE